MIGMIGIGERPKKAENWQLWRHIWGSTLGSKYVFVCVWQCACVFWCHFGVVGLSKWLKNSLLCSSLLPRPSLLAHCCVEARMEYVGNTVFCGFPWQFVGTEMLMHQLIRICCVYAVRSGWCCVAEINNFVGVELQKTLVFASAVQSRTIFLRFELMIVILWA